MLKYTGNRVSKNSVLVLNGSSIKISSNKNETRRPFSSRTTTSSASSRAKFKVTNEIERWAYGHDKDSGDEKAQDSDEIKSIDDKYLETIVQPDLKDESLNEREDPVDRRQKITSIIRNIRDHKQMVTEMCKKDPTLCLELSGYAIKQMTLDNSRKNASQSQIDTTLTTTSGNSSKHTILLDSNLNQSKTGVLNESASDKKLKKESATQQNSLKFKPASGVQRLAMPGRLQQNITLERTFFKDLLKLSKQRYLAKVNADFQKRKFTENQTKKGLCDPNSDIRSIWSSSAHSRFFINFNF